MKLEDLKIEIVPPPARHGQSAGVLPTRVKVTHLPTGISAECGSERSQLRNRNVCMAMIEYGLAEMGWGIPLDSTSPA